MARRKTGGASTAQAQSTARLAASLEFFLSSIRDPHNPKHCGTCLNGAFIECTMAERLPLDQKDVPKKSDTTVSRSPELWNAVVLFLLLKRTDKQLDRLLTRLSECSCCVVERTGDIQRYHERALAQTEREMTRMYNIEQMVFAEDKEKFTSNRCAFIIELFSAFCMVVHHSRIKSVAKGSSKSWPNHPTDLMPFGAESFVQGMLQWYRFVPDTIIFQATGMVLRFCQSLVIPSLIKYKFSHTVVESCRQLVDRTMVDICSEDFDEVGRQRIALRFRFRVMDVFAFLRAAKEQKYDCYAALMRGCETKAMQLCSILLYLSYDPKMPPQGAGLVVADIAECRHMAEHGQHLFRFFHMHMYPRPDMPVHPSVEHIDLGVFPISASWRAPAQSAISVIKTFRSESLCSAFKCPNSLQSAGKDFQRCGRCTVVAYCGRECQTKAWKEEKYSHKRICPLLRNLMERGGGSALFFSGAGEGTRGPDGMMAFTNIMQIVSNWKRAGVPEDDFLLVEDWSKWVTESRGYPMPDGTEWTPGYEDYNDLIAQLSAQGRGPKAKFLNRLARWPSEVAKEERLLKVQPFWGEEIEGN
ncbi:hypothetical protein BDZ97DRAFT_1803284 [Flammula alnicola]|nr:hypothetical protein BDZ97DRAFT_1803284 [Flammula alnicola]